jgi:hypothetical protein
MRFQDYISDETKKAATEAFRYAKAVPADKIEWKPMEAGRSVLEQCREMAKCPDWALDILAGKEMDFGNEEEMAKQFAEMGAWQTVEECERQCLAKLDKLAEHMRNTPDEKLSDTRFLPFDGGRDFTWAEMMDYPRWNFNYHLGQIAYVQTLYGDKDMH